MNTTAQIEAEILDLQEQLEELRESGESLEDVLAEALEISDKIKRLERKISVKGVRHD